MDDYKEELLLADQEKSGAFSTFRMIPPGKMLYYFMAENEIITANDQDSEECKLIDGEKWITSANVIHDAPQIIVKYTKESLSQMRCMPRPPPKALVKKERLKTPWDFFKSVFKGKNHQR